MAKQISRPSPAKDARDEGNTPAGGERPEIVQVNSNRASDVTIKRDNGNGGLAAATIPIVNSDNTQTQVLEP